MELNQPYIIRTVSELHKIFGFPKPDHPLISVIDIKPFEETPADLPKTILTHLYTISLKKNFRAPVKIKYGQQEYDFDEGVLSFIAPGQVFSIDPAKYSSSEQAGWMLFVHPDFLWNSTLTKFIRQYEFFGYSVNEALFLSEKEELAITHIIKNIQQEYHSNIDKFSHGIIISQLQTLLNLSERYYERQFLTRRKTSHFILERMEDLLNAYFDSEETAQNGLPSVSYFADKLFVSPDYLGGLLKTLTGLNAQEHIHEKLIEKAKEKLSNTGLTISEIAYLLGFEHPQSFSKLFKAKTKQSPLKFRQSLN